MLLELALEHGVVGRLAGEAVAVLGEHHVHAPGLYEISDMIEAGPVQVRPAPAGVGDLLEDLVPFAGSVFS